MDETENNGIIKIKNIGIIKIKHCEGLMRARNGMENKKYLERN
jgi:hypothetical protein